MIAKAKPTITIEAVIVRVDGTKVDLGTICSARKKKKNIFQKIIKGMVK